MIGVNRASDADSGPNAVLRYSLIGGNTQAHFVIDSLSGDVAVVQSLDYEAIRNYRLVIRAQGKQSTTDFVSIQTTITRHEDAQLVRIDHLKRIKIIKSPINARLSTA